MRRPPSAPTPLHALVVAAALSGAACNTPSTEPELEQTEDSLRCVPAAIVPTEAEDNAQPPLTITHHSADFCKDVEDLAAVVAHVEALEQLLEEGSDEDR
jgi:hypothetical protein